MENNNLTTNCIRIGLREIDDDDYRKTLREIIQRKSRQIDEKNLFVKRDKVARFAIQKGYEPELAWNFIKELVVE